MVLLISLIYLVKKYMKGLYVTERLSQTFDKTRIIFNQNPAGQWLLMTLIFKEPIIIAGVRKEI